MTVEIDTRDLVKFARTLNTIRDQIDPPIERALDRHANKIAATARSTVASQSVNPRPWLGTPAGIVTERYRKMERDIVSPLDPDGQSVGYRQEFGTSVQAARPFLGPALKAQIPAFTSELRDILAKVKL